VDMFADSPNKRHLSPFKVPVECAKVPILTYVEWRRLRRGEQAGGRALIRA